VQVASTTLSTTFSGSISAIGVATVQQIGQNQSDEAECYLKVDSAFGQIQGASVSTMAVVKSVTSDGSQLTFTSGFESLAIQSIPTTFYVTNQAAGPHTVAMYCRVFGLGAVRILTESIVAVATQ
jgi:hypothetical protein